MINIYVGNLPFSTTDSDLQTLFGEFGTIQKTTVISDRETKRSRGFGFVEMADDAQAKAAIEALNGKEFGGRFLTVNEARPRTDGPGRGPGPGGAGGSGGGTGGGGYRSNRAPGGGGGGGYAGSPSSGSATGGAGGSTTEGARGGGGGSRGDRNTNSRNSPAD